MSWNNKQWTIFTQPARCFAAIAEAGSIRKAADILHLSPSSVNRHLKQLEWDLQVDLFDRVPQGMQLTEAGELLLAELQGAISAHDRTRQAIGALQKGEGAGHLSVGVVECLAARIAPDLMAGLLQEFPEMSFDLRVGRTVQLTEELGKGALDILLAFNVPAFAGIEVRDVLDWPVGLVLPLDHPLAMDREPVTLDACADLDLVQLETSFGVQLTLDNLFAEAGLHPKVRGNCNSIEAVKRLVSKGVGAAILTRLDVYSELASGAFVFRALQADKPLTEPLSICTARHRKLPFDEGKLLGMLRDHLAAL